MASRRRRPTYDIFVGNLPENTDEKQVSKIFTAYGEIQYINVRMGKRGDNSKVAIVRYLCEPDADKAVKECNGLAWDSNVIMVKRMERRTSDNANQQQPRPQQQYTFGHWGQAAAPGIKYWQGNERGGANFSADHETSSLMKEWSYLTNLTSMVDYLSTNAGIGASFKPLFPKVASSLHVREVICSHIEDPVTFYGHLTSDLVELLSMSQQLQELCPSLVSVKGIPEQSKVYATRFSEDQLWYRCRIFKNNLAPKSVVHYIDYGNREMVNNQNIVLLPDHITKIPPFAIKCSFGDLTVVYNSKSKKLHTEGISYLQEAINGQVIKVTTYSAKGSGFYNIISCMHNDQNIGQEILKKGYAVPKAKEQSRKVPLLGEGPSGRLIIKNANQFSNQPNPKNQSSVPASSVPSTVDDKINAAGSFSVSDRKKQPKSPQPILGSHTGSKSNNVSKEELNKLTSERDLLRRELAEEKGKAHAAQKELEHLEARLANNNILDKIDYVIPSIQHVCKIRHYFPLPGECDVIEIAYQMVKNDISDIGKSYQNSDLQHMVEEAISYYSICQHKIKQCSDKSYLRDFAVERNEAREVLCNSLQQFLDASNKLPQSEKVAELQKIISMLEERYKPFLEMNVSTNASMDELIKKYYQIKTDKQVLAETVKENTNKAHRVFMEVLFNFQKVLALETDSNEICNFSSGKFSSSLSTLQQTLAAEIYTCDLKSNPEGLIMAELSHCLLSELQSPLKKLRRESQLIEKYSAMYRELSNFAKNKPSTSELCEVRKYIKSLKSKLRHKLADKNDIEECEENDQDAMAQINLELESLQQELHSAFIEEDKILRNLIDSYKTAFPEFEIEYPELGLATYTQYKGILKQCWDIEHFNLQRLENRFGISYKARFLNYPVIIKEYLIDSKESKEQFLDKAVKYHLINNCHIIPIQAVFFSRSERQAYAQFPFVSTTLFDRTEPLNLHEIYSVLYGVLKGLEALHSNGLVHGVLHPLTVYLQSGPITPLAGLDFCFDTKHRSNMSQLQGIKFQAPECANGAESSQASDMYSFGCLLLWMLFPNIQFPQTSFGTPDVTAVQSIIKDTLSEDDFLIINSLLQPQILDRPSAETVLSSSFFKEFDAPSSITPDIPGKILERGNSSNSDISHSAVVNVEQNGDYFTYNEFEDMYEDEEVAMMEANNTFLGTVNQEDNVKEDGSYEDINFCAFQEPVGLRNNEASLSSSRENFTLPEMHSTISNFDACKQTSVSNHQEEYSGHQVNLSTQEQLDNNNMTAIEHLAQQLHQFVPNTLSSEEAHEQQ